MQEKNKNKRSGRASFPVMLGILIVLIILVSVMLVQVFSMKKELELQWDAMNAMKEEGIEYEEIQINLPEVYYAAAGLTMEIYNSQVTDIGSDISVYNVLWSCDVGENLERKYSLVATEEMIGEHELTISIYDNALNLLAEKTCTLKVVEGKQQNEVSFEQTEDLAGYEALYSAAAAISVDREYNYDPDSESLNQAGYDQLADVIFSILCGMENE